MVFSFLDQDLQDLQDYRITGFLLSVTLIHMINGFA